MEWMMNRATQTFGVSTAAKKQSVEDDDDDYDDRLSNKPLFPLPTSAAQNRIADLLLNQQYPAVVCEGPPGTGMSWCCDEYVVSLRSLEDG